MPETEDNGSRQDGIRVIARSADILRALTEHPGGMTLSEISTAVSLPRSTVHRIITALSQEWLVAQTESAGGYRLGPEILRMAHSSRVAFRYEVRPFLDELAARSQETVNLGALVRDQVYFIDQAVSTAHPLRAATEIGESFPAWTNAAGRALLASLPDDQVDALLPKRLVAFTEHTITSHDELKADLRRVRETGISYVREEYTAGICGLGTIIGGHAGFRLAITQPVPAPRFYGNEDRLARQLLRTKREIDRALPHSPFSHSLAISSVRAAS